MTLYEECIEALGSTVKVLDKKESKLLWEDFQTKCALDDWGRINQNSNLVPKMIHNLEVELQNRLQEVNDEILIFWDECTRPVVKTNLQQLTIALDDVLAVSFDTWLLFSAANFIIEVHHSGEVMKYQI